MSPWRQNFASRQVDFQFTCQEEQVEILDKTMVIKMSDGEYGPVEFQVKYQFSCPDDQVEVKS